MASVESLKAEIEAEKFWRMEEVRFFKNKGADLPLDEGNIYRRAMIVLLYSHFEGFCKFAFAHYVKAINDERLKCSDVTPEIAALGMSKIFAELRDPQKKNPLWKNKLPDDPKLHKIARDREFLSRYRVLTNEMVVIPDEAVDLESNLKPIVLRKNLYALGLDPMQFEEIEVDISQLVGLRNNIAHGSTRAGVDIQRYEKYEKAALHVIERISANIMEAIQSRTFASAADRNTESSIA